MKVASSLTLPSELVSAVMRTLGAPRADGSIATRTAISIYWFVITWSGHGRSIWRKSFGCWEVPSELMGDHNRLRVRFLRCFETMAMGNFPMFPRKPDFMSSTLPPPFQWANHWA